MIGCSFSHNYLICFFNHHSKISAYYLKIVTKKTSQINFFLSVRSFILSIFYYPKNAAHYTPYASYYYSIL